MHLSADHGPLDYQNSAFIHMGGGGDRSTNLPNTPTNLDCYYKLLRWYTLPLGSTSGDKISDLAENKERYKIKYPNPTHPKLWS